VAGHQGGAMDGGRPGGLNCLARRVGKVACCGLRKLRTDSRDFAHPGQTAGQDGQRGQRRMRGRACCADAAFAHPTRVAATTEDQKTGEERPMLSNLKGAVSGAAIALAWLSIFTTGAAAQNAGCPGPLRKINVGVSVSPPNVV